MNSRRTYFDNLYYQHHRMVYLTIYKYVRDKSIVEDIVQEVFIALWSNLERLDQADKVEGWLFVVSTNKALSYLKSDVHKRILLHSEIAALPDTYETEEERRAVQAAEIKWKILQEAIEALPPKRQQVFQLCRLEGRTYKDTAAVLGISHETVKEHLKIAIQNIRTYIQNH